MRVRSSAVGTDWANAALGHATIAVASHTQIAVRGFTGERKFYTAATRRGVRASSGEAMSIWKIDSIDV